MSFQGVCLYANIYIFVSAITSFMNDNRQTNNIRKHFQLFANT